MAKRKILMVSLNSFKFRNADKYFDLRLLISNESAEEIEGEGGENMRMLRKKFKTYFFEITKFEAHEQ